MKWRKKQLHGDAAAAVAIAPNDDESSSFAPEIITISGDDDDGKSSDRCIKLQHAVPDGRHMTITPIPTAFLRIRV